MKKTDIAMLVLIAGASVLVSSIALNSILGDPSEKTRDIQVTDTISNSFTEPSSDIFNDEAINPTVQIVIGEDGVTPVSADQNQNNDNTDTN
ncbi:hypothetical protein KBE46_00705 [Candidatus Saccharibacteria bacterium]|jgi:hypothetical protein|nr:hypothetical protein [Candidatus Saccharibacteria bacterium]MBP9489167.1 hypothetical protein [Candidatus Saccharibacteria bacterium]MBP9552044.1 hypothetical protein [Candidatus Saccharibacteria bacterium]